MKRTAIELEKLATDPAIGFRITEKTKAEREVGLALEALGEVQDISREPSGKADFIDSEGQKWDVKAYQSYLFKSNQNQIAEMIKSIQKSLSEQENVMIDTRGLSKTDFTTLQHFVLAENLSQLVKFWPLS
ncbi:hypothetical protein [Isobaculum melis]|uniref:tRNA nuclease CdiA C-terminal domain-containing protein n=1 Tax=Isobaculum melis TaxID=142588 RepID=A0A1H9TT17_9LACT|nr:hypothetical protein [Isobaculum melis]SES00470.1 hypothetical protein SAMN04488559_11631 [Isobaculum melis]